MSVRKRTEKGFILPYYATHLCTTCICCCSSASSYTLNNTAEYSNERDDDEESAETWRNEIESRMSQSEGCLVFVWNGKCTGKWRQRHYT